MPLPIPAPRAAGETQTTTRPLYWAAWGPDSASPDAAPSAQQPNDVPRLLVLHGGPGADHQYLLPQLLRLADTYDCVFYDQRGGGRSKSAADDVGPVTWRTHVDDLAHIAAELVGDRPLHLVGYSWGGLLALLYALDAAGAALPALGAPVGGSPAHARVAPASLTLIDPAPVTRRYRDQFEADFARRSQDARIATMRADLAASGLRERDPDAYRQRAFELSVAGYFFDPANAHDLTPFRVTGRVQQSVWESLGDYDLLPHLGRLACPVLVAHGREDPIPLASSEALVAAVPGARLAVLDRCGHVPYVEQPVALFAAVLPFLGEVAGRPD
ncbi:MAG TPA: alpha/beta hydrolase [Gemmatirosa sp.]